MTARGSGSSVPWRGAVSEDRVGSWGCVCSCGRAGSGGLPGVGVL